MIHIDLRTVYINYALISLMSLVVIVFLWYQSHKRFQGIGFFMAGIAAQVVSLLLIFLRNAIPDFVSINISNTLAVGGTVLQLIGLEQFVGIRQRLTKVTTWLLAVFFVLEVYFTFFMPSLYARNMLVSSFFTFACLQIVWLLLVRVDSNRRRITLNVGITYLLYAAINALRIVVYLFAPTEGNDYFASGAFEIFITLSYQMLYVYLTYVVVLMVNERLIYDLESEEEKFNKAFRMAPYAILLTRKEDGKIFEVNDSFFRLTGYQPEEVIGETTLGLKVWANETDREKIVSTLSKNEAVTSKEFLFRKKSGELLTGLISSVNIDVSNKQVILSMIVDITDRKVIEEKLIEMNATKDKFFSIIAHDLKSPFNSILGLSEILSDQIKEKDYGEAEKISKVIHHAASKAMELVVNLLEWSRSQTGRIEYTPEYLHADLLIREIVGLFQASFEHKDIRLDIDLAKNSIIFADKAMISTVVRNLISNAIKFSRRGGIIEIKSIQSKTDWIFTIRDEGVGMKEKDLSQLFRIDKSFSTKGTENETGTGIGLILCKEFVERNNGKISVSSKPGIGSIFTITIPN